MTDILGKKEGVSIDAFYDNSVANKLTISQTSVKDLCLMKLPVSRLIRI